MADCVLARDRRRTARGAPHPRFARLSWRALLAPECAEGLLRRAIGLDGWIVATPRHREPHRRTGASAGRAGRAAGEFTGLARLRGNTEVRRTRRKPAAGDHVDPDGARIPEAVIP